MRDQIGMKAIFSCKPNPSLITNGWDEDLMRKNTMQLMTDGKGTAFEIILKDTTPSATTRCASASGPTCAASALARFMADPTQATCIFT